MGMPRDAVLFVDDEPKALKYFRRLFEDRYQVVTADSAATARTLLETSSENVSAIVCDHRMPEQTGVDFLTEVRFRWPQICRLLTTAYADVENMTASIQRANIHNIIPKPWNIEQLEAALDQARHAKRDDAPLRSAAAIIGSLAHEVVNPLVNIELKADDLIKTLRRDGSGDVTRSAEVIRENAIAVRRRMRELARVAAGLERRNALVRLSSTEQVERALGAFPFAPMERASVDRAPLQDFQFFCTPDLFASLFTNLLDNALYSVRGQPTAKVTIGVVKTAQTGEIWIRDNGPGLAPEIRERLFEPFTTSKPSGVGLGLTICHWIMQSLDGALRHREPEEGGCEFVLKFSTADKPC